MIVSAITVLCLVPFANKAFHVDDPLFVWSAKQIHSTPSDFYGFDVNWYGTTQRASAVIKNPPLACYFIAGAAWVVGWSEIALHLVFLLPVLACVIGTYLLAKRFCCRGSVTSLCLLFMPGFFVSSTTVMCDTMMLAFWIWAVVVWDKGLRTNSFGTILFAACLVGFSALTKYFGFCLIPLLFAHGLIHRRRLGSWSFPLLVPVAMLAGYEWYTHRIYAHGLLSDAVNYAAHFTNRDPGQSTIASAAFVGGCVLTPLCYAPLLWRKGKIIGALIASAALWLILVTIGATSRLGQVNRSHAPFASLEMAVLVVVGASALLLAVFDFWKNRDADSILLLFWVGGTFVFSTFLNWTINARSILPMCPAVAILVVRRLDERIGYAKGFADSLLLWLLVPAAGMSLLLAAADHHFANSARIAASGIAAKRPNVLGKLWFEGHWGFQYYMQGVGAEPLDVKQSELENGDLLAVPSSAANVFSIPEGVLRSTVVIKIQSFPYLSTMDRSLGAGFYASEWGPLPFAIGHVAPQQYEIFSVVHSARFQDNK